ncbi:MAG: hypothetical protein ACLU41_10135 [Anaerotignum lactatifermentans]
MIKSYKNKKAEILCTRKISAFFIFLEDVSNGIPFAVFRKSANKRGRLSEKDKTEMFTAKHLKMTNGRRGAQDTSSIKHAQKPANKSQDLFAGFLNVLN